MRRPKNMKKKSKSDEFMMYEYKTNPCRNLEHHDGKGCNHAHPEELARRRNPKEYKYLAVQCGLYRPAERSCMNGDRCVYAHGPYEIGLHPHFYRTKPCRYGTSCRRRVCFFAHCLNEMRFPPRNDVSWMIGMLAKKWRSRGYLATIEDVIYYFQSSLISSTSGLNEYHNYALIMSMQWRRIMEEDRIMLETRRGEVNQLMDDLSPLLLKINNGGGGGGNNIDDDNLKTIQHRIKELVLVKHNQWMFERMELRHMRVLDRKDKEYSRRRYKQEIVKTLSSVNPNGMMTPSLGTDSTSAFLDKQVDPLWIFLDKKMDEYGNYDAVVESSRDNFRDKLEDCAVDLMDFYNYTKSLEIRWREEMEKEIEMWEMGQRDTDELMDSLAPLIIKILPPFFQRKHISCLAFGMDD